MGISDQIGLAARWCGCAVSVGAGLLGAASASAQDPPPQTIPGLERFSLPSSRPTPTPTPTAAPTTAPREQAAPPPQVQPLPAAAATPRVAATPLPAESAAPAPASKPRASNPLPTNATPSPAAPPTSAVRAPVPVAPVPIPVDVPPPEVLAAVPAPTPTATAASRPLVAWDAIDPLTAAGLALLAVLGVLVGAAWWWRNRPVRERAERRRDAQHEVFALGTGGPLDPPPPAPRAQAAPAAGTDRARLELALLPKRAGTNLLSASVEYQLTIRNVGALPAQDARLDVRLLSAGPDQDTVLAAVFADPVARSITAPFALAPTATLTLDGVVMQPKDAIAVLDLPGAGAFVPVVAVNLRYGWAGGGAGQVARSFVVGIDRSGARLQPFPRDASRMYDRVAVLAYAVAVDV